VREGEYQTKIIKRLEELFPGCVILKNDPQYYQGIPDLSIFWKHHWAMLEVKLHRSAGVQPNQQHYVEQMNGMSFAAFIYPENEEIVLHDLQSAFGTAR
jgi:hypothetical protein